MQEAWSKTKVLVVDDEALIVEVIAEALERLGFEVATAHNGQVAKGLMAESPFDVVISDLRMPELDGLDLLDYSKKASPNTKFIAMTGHSDTDSKEVLSRGADEFVSKPFVMTSFVQLVNRILPNPQISNSDDGFEVV